MNHEIRKEYEHHNNFELNSSAPLIIKISLLKWSQISRNIYEPYDHDYENLISNVSKMMMIKIGARFAYTNLYEMIFVIHGNKDPKNIIKIQSSSSEYASLASTYFIKESIRLKYKKFYEEFTPVFKCLIFNFDSNDDVIGYLISKENNATIGSLKRHANFYGIEDIDNKNKYELNKDLFDKGNFDWNKESAMIKSGIYLKRNTKIECLNITEMSKLSNIEDVIFHNDEPVKKNYKNY
jgi:hypothetical protein